MSAYQELIDAGFSEAEIEQKVGEGHTIADIHAAAVADGFFNEDDPA